MLINHYGFYQSMDCTNRDKIIGYCPVYSECVVKDFCIKGKAKIENNFVELET